MLNLNRMFEPFAEEDEEPTDSAKERSRLVSSAIRRMSPEPAADENGFDGMIFDILDAWFKGVSVQEIDWHVTSAGKLGNITGPRSTYWVHPVCYAWSMEGRLGLRSDAAGRLSPGNISGPSYQPMPSSVAPFPDDKFLISVCKTKSGTALGGALLRPLAWWWCASNFSADWLLNLAQVFGLPFRWANYDPNAPQETVDAICSMLQNMGNQAWAAFPAGTTLELKNEGMRNGSDTPQGDILDRADKQCDLLVLGQTLTSDTGGGGKGGGSLALGKVHEGVKGEIIQAAANFAESVIENQLIPSILRLNYGDDDERPSIRLESEEESDLEADSQVVKTLVDAGAGEIVGLDWLGKKFGIPKPGKGEETLKKEKPEAGNLKPEAGKAEPDGDEPNGADPMLARIAGIADDGEFSEALLGYCRALKCGLGNPDEPRNPAGSPEGGRWTSGKSGHSAEHAEKHIKVGDHVEIDGHKIRVTKVRTQTRYAPVFSDSADSLDDGKRAYKTTTVHGTTTDAFGQNTTHTFGGMDYKPASVVGQTGTWESLGLSSVAEMAPDTAEKETPVLEARERLKAGFTVHTVLGGDAKFGSDALDHWSKKDKTQEDIEGRLRNLDRAVVALKNPHEVWENLRTGTQTYIHVVQDEKKQRVVDAFVLKDGIVESYYATSELRRKGDQHREGRLLHVR